MSETKFSDLINRLGRNAIPMTGDQTLLEAVEQLEQEGSTGQGTYLVVSQPEAQYKVALFTDVNEELVKLDDDTARARFTRPLSELNIPLASFIVPEDTPEPAEAFEEWLEQFPESKLIVLNRNGFVALLASEKQDGHKAPYSIVDTKIKLGL